MIDGQALERALDYIEARMQDSSDDDAREKVMRAVGILFSTEEQDPDDGSVTAFATKYGLADREHAETFVSLLRERNDIRWAVGNVAATAFAEGVVAGVVAQQRREQSDGAG